MSKEIIIKEITGTEDYENEWELTVNENDKKIFRGSYYDGCLTGSPEDLILCRNLSFLYNIKDLLMYMYNAGKENIPVKIINETIDYD